MPLDDSELRRACFALAQATSWKQGEPQSTSLDANTAKAEGFRKIAVHHSEYLERFEVDAAVIPRMVAYLEHHAIPPMGDDLSWFDEMMTVLCGLFAPNFAVDQKTRSFLQELRVAIDETIDF